MWSDGVPVSWDRNESIQCWTWHLPGLVSNDHRAMRLPCTVVPKHKCLLKTMDFVFQLFGWSLQCLFHGKFPEVAHDGAPFQDGYRKRLAGQAMGFRALLLEIKGDWEFYSDVLHLPRWNNTEGICFLCKATKEHVSLNDLAAPWRQPEMRLDHQGLMQKLLDRGRGMSPIWQYPFFKQVCVKLDWLHLADQGVTATFGASLLCLIVGPPGLSDFGSTIEARRLTLWNLLLDFYKKERMQSDKLKSLPFTRFRHKPPVLKAQAATVRKMVPWFVQLLKYLDPGNDEHRKVMIGMLALNECYKCLSRTSSHSPDYLKEQASVFGIQAASLHAQDPDKYALHPKMHLFQELCSQHIRPSHFWLYREEDFGGSLAEMAHRDGGLDSALSSSRTCLMRFCISAPPPTLVSHSRGAASSS